MRLIKSANKHEQLLSNIFIPKKTFDLRIINLPLTKQYRCTQKYLNEDTRMLIINSFLSIIALVLAIK